MIISEPFHGSATVDSMRRREVSIHHEFAWLQEQFPILNDIAIDVVDDEDFEGARFLLPEFEEDVPVVQIAAGGERDFRDLKKTRERAVRFMAEQVGVPFAEISGEQIRQFILFHEAGHAYDFLKNFLSDLDFEMAVTVWRLNSRSQLDQLPFPGFSPAELNEQILEAGGFDRWLAVDEAREVWCREHSVKSAEQLVTLQEEAYRKLDKERFADTFAAKAMQQFQSRDREEVV